MGLAPRPLREGTAHREPPYDFSSGWEGLTDRVEERGGPWGRPRVARLNHRRRRRWQQQDWGLNPPGSGGLHMEKGSTVWKNIRISALEDTFVLEMSLE